MRHAARTRRTRRAAGRLNRAAGLRLTSMMDILVVLLLFLLKSFVVEGEANVPPPGVELPNSTAESTAEASLVIAIDDDAILLGADRVASVREAVADPGMIIPTLDARLASVVQQQEEIAAMQGGQASRTATIQGDRDIEFRVLQKVMYTLNQNGYDHIALAVIKTSRG